MKTQEKSKNIAVLSTDNAESVAFTAAPINPQPSIIDIIPALRDKVEKEPCKSAWEKGIKTYAFKLLDILEAYCGRGMKKYMPNNARAFEKMLRFGADSWTSCAYGGGVHFLNREEICKTLCSPSEQKKTNYGKRKPNSCETWEDVSARAYSQAATLLKIAAAELNLYQGSHAAISLGLAESRIRYQHDGDRRTPEGTARNIIKFNEKAAYGNNGKRNVCEVDISLKNSRKGLTLSICGTVWNQQMTDCVMGGQCLDDMLKLAKSSGWKSNSIALLSEIVDLWEKHHLNNMHAGTRQQEEALKDFKGDYSARCERLKELNLYEVEHEGKPYKYGHGWIYFDIPAEDIARIWNLLNA